MSGTISYAKGACAVALSIFVEKDVEEPNIPLPSRAHEKIVIMTENVTPAKNLLRDHFIMASLAFIMITLLPLYCSIID